MRKKKNESVEERKGRIEFPMVAVSDLLTWIDKINKDHAAIADYAVIAKISTGSNKTQGGAFARVSKALKLYNLMAREGMSEMKITDFGKQILNSDEDRQKRLLFSKFLEIPIFKELYDKYPQELPTKKKPVAQTLAKQKGIDSRTAGRIVGMFYKEFDYFKDIMGKTIPAIEEPKEAKWETLPPKIESEDYSEIVELVSKLFPQETTDTKTELEELAALSKEKGLVNFTAFLDILKGLYIDKENEEIKQALKKLSTTAIEKLKQDLSDAN